MLTTLATLAALTLAQQGEMDTTVAVQAGARLDVNNFGGEIVVRTWNQNSVRVRASHSSRDRVEVSFTQTVVLVRTSGRRGPPSLVDFEITVPQWMGVTLAGVYTDITVEGVAGSISAESVQGDISVTGGTGKLSVESVDGDVTLLRIESSSVEVNTVDGDIIYDGTIKDGGSYRLATHDGDVTIAIPTGASAAVSVATFDGDFDSSFPVDVQHTGRHRFSFTIGSGKARVELETFDGDIRLRRPGQLEEPDGDHDKDHEYN